VYGINMNSSNLSIRKGALILMIVLAFTSLAVAPSNWYNPERTSDDVNHGVDYVQSMAVTNSEDFYSNTSGHCAIGQIGQNTSRVFYQWYIANANNCRTEGSSVLRSQRERQIRNKSRSEGASFRNNQSLYEYTWGNETESEVLYLNFDEGEGSIAYDKSGKGNDGNSLGLKFCHDLNSARINANPNANHLSLENKEFNQYQGGDV